MEGDHYHGDASPPLPREKKKTSFFQERINKERALWGGEVRVGKK